MMPGRRAVFMATAMLGAALVAIALRPGRLPEPAPTVQLEATLPHRINGWQGYEVANGTVLSGGRAGQRLTRQYFNQDGEGVLLSVTLVNEAGDALEARRPEDEIERMGSQLVQVTRDRLRLPGRSVPVTRVMAARGSRYEPMTYWITIGDRVVRGRLEWLGAQVLQGLSGRPVQVIEVRVSSVATEMPQGFAGHDHFINMLVAELPAAGVNRLLGPKLTRAPPET